MSLSEKLDYTAGTLGHFFVNNLNLKFLLFTDADAADKHEYRKKKIKKKIYRVLSLIGAK